MKEKYNLTNLENILRTQRSDNINVMQEFYLLYNENPIITNTNIAEFFIWNKVLKELKKFETFRVVRQVNTMSLNNELFIQEQLIELEDGLLIYLIGDTLILSEQQLEINNKISENLIYGFTIYSKNDLTKLQVKTITNIFNKCKCKQNKSINIGLVSVTNGEYYVKDFNIKLKELELLDLHYGKGFTKFNDQLINKLSTSDKGLTLLHGDPGTGKTTYIRYLIKQLIEINRSNNILYFPHSMIDCIIDPSFINFISTWSQQNTGKKYILIEDAEPLLVSRDTNRNTGITNLLNITDGLLNDIFNIQVIATFNTNISNLDKALLRPERLIARKEFKTLSLENAIKIAEHLKIDVTKIKKNMSIAEIYALLEDNSILEHDLEQKSSNIGFKI